MKKGFYKGSYHKFIWSKGRAQKKRRIKFINRLKSIKRGN